MIMGINLAQGSSNYDNDNRFMNFKWGSEALKLKLVKPTQEFPYSYFLDAGVYYDYVTGKEGWLNNEDMNFLTKRLLNNFRVKGLFKGKIPNDPKKIWTKAVNKYLQGQAKNVTKWPTRLALFQPRPITARLLPTPET